MSNMKDWQVGAMWEAEAAAEWERINADPDVDLTEAITRMGYAFDQACTVSERLAEAADGAKGTVYEARIMSIFEDLEQLQSDINSLQQRMKEEARKAG